MQKTIKKAKVTKGNTLEVELIEHHEDKTDREVTVKCDQLTHNDLLVAFDKLKYHLSMICEQSETGQLTFEAFNRESDLRNFKVTSFSIGGSDDNEGVTITGQKELHNLKILNLNTPFTKYVDEVEPYAYQSELVIDIMACIGEVELYMFEGKYAVKQLEIPFGENEEVIIAKPRKFKKGKIIEMTSEEPFGVFEDIEHSEAV